MSYKTETIKNATPCPFCGHDDVIVEGTIAECWYTRCRRCNAGTGPAKTKAGAIESWQTRVSVVPASCEVVGGGSGSGDDIPAGSRCR